MANFCFVFWEAFLKSGKVNFYQESVEEIMNIEDYIEDDFLCIVL